ncbi:MAG: M20/M25/M40 family metallo-hydrolase [Verrucomicrobia bacterium]|nr:M20/M25/M40 family metallo-hydrolase [Verrucomicrobiota bacterium]
MAILSISDKKECTEFLQKLIQTPSVVEVHPEEQMVQVIAAEAKRLGLPFQIFEKVAKRPNIYVGLPESFACKEGILLVAHLDTVPEGNPNAWKYPPFSGMMVDNKLYGRGAIDCKGGIALSLYVLKILKDLGQLHRAKFVGVADEESGASSEFGLKYLLEKGLQAQGAIYTYGAPENDDATINIGHRGVLRSRVIFKGESVHSGASEWQKRERGVNANECLVDFVVKMRSLKSQFPEKHPDFGVYTFDATPTLIKGGHAVSIVPDVAEVVYDIRTLPGQTKEEILQHMRTLAEKVNEDKKGKGYDIQVTIHVPAVLSNKEAPMIQHAVKLHEKIFGKKPTLKGSGPANESYMLIQKGIPAIAGYGPLGGGFHGLDEYANLETLEKSVTFLVELAKAM